MRLTMGQIVDESLEADAMLARDHNLLAGNPLCLLDLHFQNMGFVSIFNLNIINFEKKTTLTLHSLIIDRSNLRVSVRKFSD